MVYHVCDIREIPRPNLRYQSTGSFRPLPEVSGAVRFYDREEMALILAKCRGTWETVARLGYQVGFRRSEIFWCAWTDVHFDRNTIGVTAKYDREGRLIWQPKTWEEREVPMGAGLRAYLLALKKKAAGPWVLGKDRPANVNVMTAYFRKITRRSGVEDGAAIHILRHTYAAWHATGGTSMRHLQKLLGHKKITTTEIYAHLQDSALTTAVEKIAGL
jgi:site-specific recombinase XerD